MRVTRGRPRVSSGYVEVANWWIGVLLEAELTFHWHGEADMVIHGNRPCTMQPGGDPELDLLGLTFEMYNLTTLEGRISSVCLYGGVDRLVGAGAVHVDCS